MCDFEGILTDVDDFDFRSSKEAPFDVLVIQSFNVE
jgi:hypothetical protein